MTLYHIGKYIKLNRFISFISYTIVIKEISEIHVLITREVIYPSKGLLKYTNIQNTLSFNCNETKIFCWNSCEDTF